MGGRGAEEEYDGGRAVACQCPAPAYSVATHCHATARTTLLLPFTPIPQYTSPQAMMLPLTPDL